MNGDTLGFIYSGGNSKRFHTVHTIFSQNIAEHSFGVAWWCEALTNKGASKNLIMAALAHDLSEHIVGDVPSPTKRKVASLANELDGLEAHHLDVAGLIYPLAPEEKRILKLADILEGMMFCVRELQSGNRSPQISYVYENYISYTITVVKSEEEKLYINQINRLWRDLHERK